MNRSIRDRYGAWALVTGASSGIGRAIVQALSSQGMNIVAVARDRARLGALATEITSSTGVEVRTVVQDLGVPEAVEQLASAVDDLQIGVLVVNAGMELTGEFISTDLNMNQRLATLNAIGPMELIHHFGNHMTARGKGAILIVSSTFGYQGVPYVAHYAATKAYLLALGEALNVELRPRGVDVTVLSPGLTATPMIEHMPVDFSKMPLRAQQPVTVARTAVRALGRRATVISGLMNRIMVAMNRIIPRSWPPRLFGFLLRRAMKAA